MSSLLSSSLYVSLPPRVFPLIPSPRVVRGSNPLFPPPTASSCSLPSPLFLQISLHSILTFSNESYGQTTSVSNLFGGKDEEKETKTVDVVDAGSFAQQLGKSNAVFLILCRNEEVDGAVKSIRELEDRFNHKYHYPWVFLNDVEFTEDFKKCVLAVPFHQSYLTSFGCSPFLGVSGWLPTPRWSSVLSRKTTGTNRTGSTKTRLRRHERRWRRTTLSMEVRHTRLSIFNHRSVLMLIQGVSHIATCVGSTPGSSTATS
jgi:hypothetical protein